MSTECQHTRATYYDPDQSIVRDPLVLPTKMFDAEGFAVDEEELRITDGHLGVLRRVNGQREEVGDRFVVTLNDNGFQMIVSPSQVEESIGKDVEDGTSVRVIQKVRTTNRIALLKSVDSKASSSPVRTEQEAEELVTV